MYIRSSLHFQMGWQDFDVSTSLALVDGISSCAIQRNLCVEECAYFSSRFPASSKL